MVLLHVCVTYELVWITVTPKKNYYIVLEFFFIIDSIVNGNAQQGPIIQQDIFFFSRFKIITCQYINGYI